MSHKGSWTLSKHQQNSVDCSTCHGSGHTTYTDVTKAQIPTPDTCAVCHQEQVDQFMKGKHKQAWAAMNAVPTIHWQPVALIEGKKGCGGCHKIGTKTVIEQKLFVMFLEHRMRTFQGAFHANPDYATWYGWSEMQRDLTEIKALAEDMRVLRAFKPRVVPAKK